MMSESQPQAPGAGGPGPAPVEDLGGAEAARAALAFTLLGVTLRLVRYLLNFPLWCDESMLAANLLDRGFLGLLEPLDYRQVAPALFLWVERAAVEALGFREWTLRLFPTLCGVAGVLLFRHVAGRLVGGGGLVLAVAIFAVSGQPLRHAAEVKPYASDLLVALAMLAMAVEWWRRPDRPAWLWGLAAFSPIAVALSFPAILAAGGIGLTLLVATARSPWSTRLPVLAFGLAASATFLGLLPMYQTAPQDHDYFHRDWSRAFPPPGGGPIGVAGWFLARNTGVLFAYPDGGANGGSAVTTLCFVAGAIALGRSRRWVPLGLLLGPFGMALAASAMHRYPYGLSGRTMQYLGPAICLLAGLGMARLISRSPIGRVRRRGLAAAMAGLMLLGVGRMGWDLVHPYKSYSDDRSRAFAQWFWSEMSRDAEVACLGTELGVVADPRHWDNDLTDQYLCYRRMFSPRHRAGEPLRLDDLGPDRPLRCVLYNEFPQESPEFREWMGSMLDEFDLRAFRHFPVHTMEARRGTTWDLVYMVYEFVPKAPVDRQVASGPPASSSR